MSSWRLRVALLGISLLACLSLAGSGDAQISREFDWMVDIETTELKEYLSYPGSTLRPMVKAQIFYEQTGESGTGFSGKGPVKYQDLFYRGCNPVGLRRFHTFDVESGDGLGIRVKHKGATMSSGETCAAANAVVRVLLDAYMNGNMVISVLVPSDSFGSIVQELHRLNFYAQAEAPPDVPQFSSIVLPLRSDPPGSEQTMFYSGRTTD